MNTPHPAQISLHRPEVIEKLAMVPARRAALMAFVADAEAEAYLRECLSDLSFSNFKIMRGGIVRAINHLGEQRSPKILIVDVSDVEMPASRVHDLAEVCEPAVTVIAIGKRNDVGLYRDLMKAGISDYIVKPVTPALLAQALSPKPTAGEIPSISQKLGKMVAVVGARGGVGTTTLAVNLAWYLADRQCRRIALVDLDLQNGDCALALNLKPTAGLREALTNPLRIDSLFLERAMMTHSERLFVLSSEEPLRDEMEITAEAVDTLLSELRAQFHYVIADVPRITATPYRLALDIADHRIIVADHTLRSVRDAARLRTALGGSDAAHRNVLVINRSGEGGRREVTLEEMGNYTAIRPKIVIPFQPKLFAAEVGRAKVAAARRGKFAEAVAALAGEISGRMPERRRWWRWAT
jgi:pilus assembly protein CpaE